MYGQAASMQYRDHNMLKSDINFFGASYAKNENSDILRSPIIPREGESSDNDFSLL